jgi:hypothetical protein
MEKKTLKQELAEQLQLHREEASSLRSTVDHYIDLISNTVPNEYCKHFGIGVAGSHNQFGATWGFYNHQKDCYTVTGDTFYIANDYNCKCIGSNSKQVLEFAKDIQVYIKQGIAELKHDIELMEKINKELIFLKEL